MTDEKLRAAARDLGENVLWLVEQILIKHNMAILEGSKEAIDAAVAVEREACADIAENWKCNGMPRTTLAEQIRARGENDER
jgi:hypothetical protein